jgi:hypothetical protein
MISPVYCILSPNSKQTPDSWDADTPQSMIVTVDSGSGKDSALRRHRAFPSGTGDLLAWLLPVTRRRASYQVPYMYLTLSRPAPRPTTRLRILLPAQAHVLSSLAGAYVVHPVLNSTTA